MKESVFEFDFLLLEEADMPKGFQSEPAVTKMMRENKFFLDSQSKVVRRVSDATIHIILCGLDKVIQRSRVFEKCGPKCVVCGAHAPEQGQDGFRGEWNHTERCDCLHGAEVRCGQLKNKCHRHRTSGFVRKANFTVTEEIDASSEA